MVQSLLVWFVELRTSLPFVGPLFGPVVAVWQQCACGLFVLLLHGDRNVGGTRCIVTECRKTVSHILSQQWAVVRFQTGCSVLLCLQEECTWSAQLRFFATPQS